MDNKGLGFEEECAQQEKGVIEMKKDEKRRKILDYLFRLNYWFCNEMLLEEEHCREFDKACQEAEARKEAGDGNMSVIVSGAPGNAKCMKGCMEDTVEVINYLRNKDNHEYIESWQLAGAEAMFAQCKKDGIIPFDLPAALMAVFGLWDQISERCNR